MPRNATAGLRATGTRNGGPVLVLQPVAGSCPQMGRDFRGRPRDPHVSPGRPATETLQLLRAPWTARPLRAADGPGASPARQGQSVRGATWPRGRGAVAPGTEGEAAFRAHRPPVGRNGPEPGNHPAERPRRRWEGRGFGPESAGSKPGKQTGVEGSEGIWQEVGPERVS